MASCNNTAVSPVSPAFNTVQTAVTVNIDLKNELESGNIHSIIFKFDTITQKIALKNFIHS